MRKFVGAITGNQKINMTEFKPSVTAPAWICVVCSMPVCHPCKNGLFNEPHGTRRRIGFRAAM